MIGREGELRAVAAFLERCRSGFGLLLVPGEPGIGKTTLWREALGLARSGSFEVLVSRAAEAESRLAFGGLIDLFAEADAVVATLPARQRRVLEIALLQADARDDLTPQPDEVGVAALAVLRRLARHGPVVVAIDDLHWLDGATARVLAYIARRLDGEPVALLATQRSSAPLPFDPDCFGLGARLERLALSTLSLGALHALVCERTGVVLGRAMLARVGRAAGGNPFFALEIVQALRRRSPVDEVAATAPLPVPDSLRQLVVERMAALPPAACEAVLVAFALSRPTRSLVEAALGQTRRAASGLLLAEEAGALELRGASVELAHPLLGSTLYAELSAARRRALHGRLAALPLDPEERARQLALASSGPSEAVAQALEAAARRALGRGAPDAASEFGELALQVTPDSYRGAIARRTFALAMAEYTAGDTERARARWRRLAETAGPGLVRARARWHMAQFLEARSVDESESLLAGALSEVGSDRALAASIEATWARTAWWSGRLLEAEAHAAASMQFAESVSDPAAQATALSQAATIAFQRGEAGWTELLERALALEPRLGNLPVEALPSKFRALIHARAGDDLDGARAYLDEVRATALVRGDDAALASVFAQLCEVECWAGNIDAARTSAVEASEWVARSGVWYLSGFSRYGFALLDALAGRVEEARDAATGILADALAEASLSPDGRRAEALLGFVELTLGRPAQALAVLTPLRERLEAGGYVEPAVFHSVPDEIEALAALGRLDEAEGVLTPFESAARRLGRRWAVAASMRSRGQILAGRGDLAGAREMLGRAVAASAELGRPFELGRALLALGIAERRDRQKAAAVASFEASVAAFGRAGSPIWAERARGELGRVGLRPRAPATLTPTERRVAELAAVGHTNREIAGLTFMSAKTVEANLGRVYRKLEVRSRAQLASRLAPAGGNAGVARQIEGIA